MTNFQAPPPPPPMPRGGVAAKAGSAGWGAVVAGVLGVIGLAFPWFAPRLSKPLPGVAKLNASPFHAWNGGIFFFLVAAPILLILFGAVWFQALRGTANGRFASSPDPVRAMSIQSVGAGVIALILSVISFPLMKTHYKNWDLAAKEFKIAGATLRQNPQIGLYAVMLGAIVLIAVGVAGLMTKPTVTPARAPEQGFTAPTPGFDGAPQGYGAPSGYGGPVQSGPGDGGPIQGGPAAGGPLGSGFPPPPAPPGY